MNKSLRLGSLLLFAFSAGAGCEDNRTSTFTDDAATPAKDLATSPKDLTGMDMVVIPIDMTGAGDLTMPADLATSEDLVMTSDLLSANDLVTASDLVMSDLSTPADQSPIRDLVVPLDQVAALDLAGAPDGGVPDMAVVIDGGGAPDLAGIDLATGSDLSGMVMADMRVVDLAATPDLVAAPDLVGGATPYVVVLQVNDGKAAATSAATPGFLHRYGLDGTEAMGGGWPVSLPIAVNGNNHPITFSGTATSEGQLSRSADGRYITLGGYDAAPGVAAIASTTVAANNRVVARVDGVGNVDTTTRFNAVSFDASNIRGVTSIDGNAFWAAGTSSGAMGGGIQYIAFGQVAQGVQILATPNNTRVAHLVRTNGADQLYASSGSTGYTTFMTVGAGAPTMAGQTAGLGVGLPTTGGSPYSYAVLDRDAKVAGVDTAYVADDHATASGGGIQKWTFDGAKWTLVATYFNGITTGARGLCAFVTGNNVTVAVTTAEAAGTPNNVAVMVDDGSMNPVVKIVVASPANTQWRGVALAP